MMEKDDIVAVAIAKAKTKLATLEDEKITADTQSLCKRFIKAYEKLTDAKTENSDQIDILQQSVDKLKREIDANRKALKKIKADRALKASKRNKPNSVITNNNGSQ